MKEVSDWHAIARTCLCGLGVTQFRSPQENKVTEMSRRRRIPMFRSRTEIISSHVQESELSKLSIVLITLILHLLRVFVDDV
jgi:hypothetical protein